MSNTQDPIHALVREAGGIVHSDGNIFFTNKEQFYAATSAVRLQSPAPQPPGFDAHDMATAAADGFRDGVASTQASEPSADIHANSETLPGECWKNPLFPLETRLQMADGAVAFERKVNANLRARLEAAPARVVEPMTDDVAAEREACAQIAERFSQGIAGLIRARAHGITTTPAAKEQS